MSGGIGAELSGGNFWQGAVIGGIVAGLNHVMHMQSNVTDNDDEWMLTKDGKMVKVGNKGGDKVDYLYDEPYGPVIEKPLLEVVNVEHSIVTTGLFRSKYPVIEGFGYRIHTKFGGHGLYDPSLDIISNIPLSGGATLTKMGLTRLPKTAYGLKVGLGGSSTTLKSSYFFKYRLGINAKMGFRLPTIMGKSTNDLGVFLGRNSAVLGTGLMGYGVYRFINQKR